MSALDFESADFTLSLQASLSASLPHSGALELLRYSVNKNYKWRPPGGDLFVRLYRPGKETPATIQAEHDFLRYLTEHDYPVAEPVPLIDGTTFAQGPAGLFYAVFPFLPGEAPGIHTQAAAAEWGKALGRLHELSRNYPLPQGSAKRREWNEASWVRDCREQLATTLPPELSRPLLREHDLVERYLSELPRGPEEFGLIHNDFHPGNLLRSGEKTWVLDFDDALYCWFAWDFALPLHRLGGGHMKPDTEGMKAAFVQGYCSQRALSDDWLNRIPHFERIRHLFMISWLAERRHEKKWEQIFPKYAATHAAYVQATPTL